MALITLSQFKTLTNTTDSSNDALLTELITIISNEIENYCNRTFNAATYYKWVDPNCSNIVIADQYPVIKILLIGDAHNAFNVANASATKRFNLSVINDILYIVDESLTETSYSFATYTSLSALKTQIELDWADLTCTIDTDADTSTLSKTLKEQNYALGRSTNIDMVGVKSSQQSIVIKDNMFYCDGNPALIVYNAGYTTIPLDLQNICALIIRDALGIGLSGTNGNIKSESIEGYSYTLADGFSYVDLIHSYGERLSVYKHYSF